MSSLRRYGFAVVLLLGCNDAPTGYVQDAKVERFNPTDGIQQSSDGKNPDGPKVITDGSGIPGKDGQSSHSDGAAKTDGTGSTTDGGGNVSDAKTGGNNDAIVSNKDAGSSTADKGGGVVIIDFDAGFFPFPDSTIVTEGGVTIGSTQCTDGIDNDGDGKKDGADPECTGPGDNSEASYATGIPGDNMDGCKQDCFFDGNSGAGDDKCDWNLKCDPLSPGAFLPKKCPYDANYKNCPKTQSQACLTNCRTITPNGCDCFGCCAFPYNNSTITVMLTSTCTPAKLGDASACPRCTQVKECLNTCGACEVCVGKPAPEPGCTIPTNDGGVVATPDAGASSPDGGGSTSPCPPGYPYCGPGGIPASSCPVNSFCITGCCVPLGQ